MRFLCLDTKRANLHVELCVYVYRNLCDEFRWCVLFLYFFTALQIVARCICVVDKFTTYDDIQKRTNTLARTNAHKHTARATDNNTYSIGYRDRMGFCAVAVVVVMFSSVFRLSKLLLIGRFANRPKPLNNKLEQQQQQKRVKNRTKTERKKQTQNKNLKRKTKETNCWANTRCNVYDKNKSCTS